MQNKTLVAIAAHADDFELNAAGYASRWRRDGGQVAIIMMTNNCSGGLLPTDGKPGLAYRLPPEKWPPDQTTAIRHREQAAAADRLGAKLIHLDYCQRHYWNGSRQVTVGFEMAEPPPTGVAGKLPLIQAFRDRQEIQKLIDLLLSLDVGEVLTQTVIDLDPEHHMVAAMAWQAFMLEPRLHGVPLRFWSPGSSAPDGLFDPEYDRIIDITDTYDAKVELCHLHASQMTPDRLRMIRDHAEHWGAKIGVRYAEPYKTATLGRSYQLPQ